MAFSPVLISSIPYCRLEVQGAKNLTPAMGVNSSPSDVEGPDMGTVQKKGASHWPAPFN